MSLTCLGRTVMWPAILLVTVACRDSSPDGQVEVFTAPEFEVIDAVRNFGAVPDGITDNEPMLQRALDVAAARGGGTVHLPEGIYGIARPLIVRSRVHLVGEGKGKTVLRSLVSNWGKIAEGAGVTAAVAMVAANSSSVSDLTVDLSVAGTHSNGVVALPSGLNFEGTPSADCEISHVEVIGGGNYHAYMIWNLRGRGIRIVHNVVDGRVESPVTSNQEGIESYGGRDVLVGWNVVRNIGNTGLNFGSAGLPDTGIDGLEVVGNVVTNSGRGLNIGPWMDPSGPQNVVNTRIEDNEFTDLWQTGIYVPAQPGTEIRGLQIIGNRIRNVGSAATLGATGIHFQGTLATDSAAASAAVDNVVRGNFIGDVRGVNAIGVLVNYFPNLAITANTIVAVDYAGVQAFGSHNLSVEENWISEIQRIGVGSYGPLSSVYVRNNTFLLWDRGGAKVAGVSIDGATAGEVRNNVFWHDAVSGSAVRVEAQAANVIVFGNQLHSAGTTALPFLNYGFASNLGSFVAAPGDTAISLPHSLAKPTSTIIVAQASGDRLENHRYSSGRLSGSHVSLARPGRRALPIRDRPLARISVRREKARSLSGR